MMNFLAINWAPSPEIFSIGPVAVRYYSVLFVSGFIIGYYIFKWFFKREGVPERILENLLYTLLIATMVGARLGHCLFYEPEYYLARPIEILKVWEGGLASHGGAIAILLAMWWFVHSTSRNDDKAGKPDEFRDIRKSNRSSMGIYLSVKG